jgi:hypothetical protein
VGLAAHEIIDADVAVMVYPWPFIPTMATPISFVVGIRWRGREVGGGWLDLT